MLKLSDNEKQEIVRFLEADKPLPEKYRFLLFEDKREVELVWNGKHNRVSNLVLPFQTIEQVDEPRAEKPTETAPQLDLFSTDARGRQLQGWSNKLIWGDNKLILSSLLHGPMRQEIEKQGGLKLIYIDPPFDVGADFSMNIEIGEDSFTKKPNILEEIAYRDTWGKGTDSFIAMIYERLLLMRDLLADDGSIYVHCDWRVNGLIRLLLDEVFGKDHFLNDVGWIYGQSARGAKAIGGQFARNHDTIFYYSRTSKHKFNGDVILRRYTLEEAKSAGFRQDERGVWFKTAPRGDYTDESIKKLKKKGEYKDEHGWYKESNISLNQKRETSLNVSLLAILGQISQMRCIWRSLKNVSGRQPKGPKRDPNGYGSTWIRCDEFVSWPAYENPTQLCSFNVSSKHRATRGIWWRISFAVRGRRRR